MGKVVWRGWEDARRESQVPGETPGCSLLAAWVREGRREGGDDVSPPPSLDPEATEAPGYGRLESR